MVTFLKTNLFLAYLSRFAVWGLLFGVVFLLRSFFLLVFLTFIFAYIQAHAVESIKPWIPTRQLRVVFVGVFFLFLLVLLGSWLIPHITRQAQGFVNNFSNYGQALDLELVRMKRAYPFLEEIMPQLQATQANHQHWDFKDSTLANLLQLIFGIGSSEGDSYSVKVVLEAIRNISSVLLAISSSFLLSLLFSFLIVLDLPRLTTGTKALRDTKLRFIYDEVAGSIVSFAKTLGRAFQAQFFIAILNTILTVIGLWVINIRGELAFLSLIVFFCSFIPIIGVFLSSIPICMLALEQGGLSMMLLSVVLITLIHMIEAYILNPKIFGHHLRMNPVVVLILLTVSGKLFGFWGLVLCLPVSTYIFREAIQIKESTKNFVEKI